MAKIESLEILIQANADQLRSELQATQNQLRSFQGSVEKSSKTVGSTFTGGVFKGVVASQVFMGTLRLITKGINILTSEIMKSIGVTQEFESALIGLETIAGRKLGADAIPKATQAARDLASDGLMPVTDAALGLKNLLASGFNLKEATNLMYTFKDAAAFGRQSSLSFGKAISSATEGIKNGNSILVDNAGITKNLSMILTEAGFSQQDLMRATTDASVRQALYNGILKEGNLFQGDAAKLANSTAGEVAKMSVAIINMRVALGGFIKPIQQVLQQGLLAFFSGVSGTVNSAADNIRAVSVKIAGFLLGLLRVIGSLLSRIPIIGKNFAGLANLTIKPVKNLDKAGAAGGNAAKGMDKASDSAKKLKKEMGGLAKFDELNVLGTTSDSSKGSTGTGGIASVGGGGSPELGLDFSKEINKQADIVTAGFEQIKGRITGILDEVKVYFGDTFGGITGSLSEFITNFKESWGVYGKDIINGAKETIGLLYTNVFKPVFDPILEIIKTNLGGASKYFLGFIKDVQTVVNFLLNIMKPVFVGVGGIIKDVWGGLISVITAVVSTVMGVLSGLASFLSGVFTGNWSKAWDGIKKIFSSVWNGLGSLVKIVFNAIIDSINNFINSVNKIKVPDWIPGVGGKGVTIPNIPRMSMGGVVKQDTMAILHKSSNEAVLPLKGNTEWISELAGMLNGSNNGQPIYVTVEMGGEKLATKVINSIRDSMLTTNTNILQ